MNDDPNRARKRIAVYIFAGVFHLNLVTMPIKVQHNLDASSQTALAVRYDKPTRPNHVWVTPTYHVWLVLTEAVGIPHREFIRLQLLTSLVGAASCAIFYLCMLNFGCRCSISLCVALTLAFSHAHWVHSRETETDIFPEFFLVFTIFVLSLQWRDRLEAKQHMLLAAAAGISAAVSILYSMNFILLFPALCVLVLAANLPATRLKALALFALICAGVTFVAYSISLHNTTGQFGLRSMVNWILHHQSEDSVPGLKSFSVFNVLRGASGCVNYFSGESAATTAVKQALTGGSPLPVAAKDWLSWILGTLILMFLAINCIPRQRSVPQWTGLLLLATATLPVALFNFQWLGSDPQFWMPLMPFVLLQVAIVLSHSSPPRAWDRWAIRALLAVLLALFVMNAPYPVPTLVTPNGAKVWQDAVRFSRLSQEGDLVIFAAGWPLLIDSLGSYETMHLFWDAAGLKDEEYVSAIADRIDQHLKQGHHVYVKDIFAVSEPMSIGRWDMVEHTTGLTRERLAQALDMQFFKTAVAPDAYGETVWMLTPR